jgi:hypothetical protein
VTRNSTKDFLKLLKNIKHPQQKEGWDVEGILHGSANQSYKFDLRPIKKFEDSTEGKIGFFDTKAEKMVFSFKNKWIILDIEELHEYIQKNKITDLLLQNLIIDLTWNIIINK